MANGQRARSAVEAGDVRTGSKHYEGGSAASPPAGVGTSGPPWIEQRQLKDAAEAAAICEETPSNDGEFSMTMTIAAGCARDTVSGENAVRSLARSQLSPCKMANTDSRSFVSGR